MPSFIRDGKIDRYTVHRWAAAEARKDVEFYETHNPDAAPTFLQALKDRLRQARKIAQMALSEDAARRERIAARSAPLPPLSDADLAAIHAEETAVRNLYNAW